MLTITLAWLVSSACASFCSFPLPCDDVSIPSSFTSAHCFATCGTCRLPNGVIAQVFDDYNPVCAGTLGYNCTNLSIGG